MRIPILHNLHHHHYYLLKIVSIHFYALVSLQVGNRDTLTSVAARFDTTPSELTSLNKLNSSFIYAGQQLFVPDKTAINAAASNDGDGDSSTASAKDSPTEEKARKLSTEEIQQEEKEKGT